MNVSAIVKNFLMREEMRHEAKVVSVERYIERAKVPMALPTSIPIDSHWMVQLARSVQRVLVECDGQTPLCHNTIGYDDREFAISTDSIELLSEAFEKLSDEYNAGDKWLS